MQRVPIQLGVSGTFSDANRLVSVSGANVLKESRITDGVSGNVLTVAGTLTNTRTWTGVDASDTFAFLGQAQTFTVAQTIDTGTGALVAAISTPTQLRIACADGAGCTQEIISYGSSAFVMRGRAIGGTRAIPAATTNGQVGFNMSYHGHDGSVFTTSAAARYFISANGLWSGTNQGANHIWTGTLNGAVGQANWMWLNGTTGTDPSGTLGIGAAPTTGNGLLQLASGTTKASGVAWGTDTFLYRSAAGQLTQFGTGGLLVQQAATQDAVLLLGRAGGTSSYSLTLTPAAMTASYTLTIPALSAADTIATLGLSNVFSAAQVINTTGLTPAVVTAPPLRILSASAIFRLEYYAAGATGPQFSGFHARGTAAVPTATQSGDVLTRVIGNGYGATGFFSSAQFRFVSAENFSDTAQGTKFQILLTQATTTGAVSRLEISDVGEAGYSVTPVAGNGLIQLATGTTIASGISGAGDTFLFRIAAGAWSFNNGNPTANTFSGHRIFGCNNATAATAGTLGEPLISTVSAYANFTTTATYQQLTSLSITSGEWDVIATVTFSGNAATITTTANAIFAVSSTTASAAGATEGLNLVYIDQNVVGASKQTIMFRFPLSLTATTTYYLNGQSTFTLGNPQFVCTLQAVRRR